MKTLSIAWWLVLLLSVSARAQNGKQAPESEFADFDGVKVHYETVGKGAKALVFIHGWTCNAAFWRQSVNEFPEYRVIAIDLPGHGQSDKPHIDYTMDYLASSVAAVMSDANIDKAVLVGHSIGARVISRFYHLHPDQTLGLVMVDGSPLAATKKEVKQFVEPLLASYKENAAKSLDEGMLKPIRDEKLKQEIRSAMLATPDYVGVSVVEASAMEATDEKFQTDDKIAVPVLAVLADSSPWPDIEADFRSIAADLDFEVWQGVSHFIMLEQPARFNKTVENFVSRNNLL